MRRSLLVFVALLAVVVAVAASRAWSMNVGDTATVTCSRGAMAVTSQQAHSVGLACTTTVPPTSTTATVPPTSTTTTPPTTTTVPANVGWPDATNTGIPAGTTLAAVGSFTSSTDGQTIAGIDVASLAIANNNVTVKNSLIHGIPSVAGTGVTFVNCTFDGSAAGGDPMVTAANLTLVRVNAFGYREGPRAEGLTMTDSYLHDFRVVSGDHTDGVQRYDPGSVKNDVIRHNTIAAGPNANAAIFYADNWQGTLILDHNLLSGGGYTLRVHESGTATVTGNVVVKGSYGYGPVNTQSAAPFAAWTGNTLSDGTPI